MIFVVSKISDAHSRQLGVFTTRESAIEFTESTDAVFTGQFKLVRKNDQEIVYAYNGDINDDIITIIKTDNE